MLNDFITIHQLKKPINNQEYFINPTSINVRFSIKMHSNSLDKFTINDPKEKKEILTIYRKNFLYSPILEKSNGSPLILNSLDFVIIPSSKHFSIFL